MEYMIKYQLCCLQISSIFYIKPGFKIENANERQPTTLPCIKGQQISNELNRHEVFPFIVLSGVLCSIIAFQDQHQPN